MKSDPRSPVPGFCPLFPSPGRICTAVAGILALAATGQARETGRTDAFEEFFVGHWKPIPREADVRTAIEFDVWKDQPKQANGSVAPPSNTQIEAAVQENLPSEMASAWRRSDREHLYFGPGGTALELTRWNSSKDEPDLVIQTRYRVETAQGRLFFVKRKKTSESWYCLVPAGREPPGYDENAEPPFHLDAVRQRGLEDAFYEQQTHFRILDENHFQVVVLDWSGLDRARTARTYRRVSEPPDWARGSIRARAPQPLPQGQASSVDSSGFPAAKNAIGMELVLLPPGEFTMGSEETYGEEEPRFGPSHPVRISDSFYLGRYEVTQGQWEELFDENPSFFGPTGEGADLVKSLPRERLPVENVTWYEAARFCNRLSDLEGYPPYFRLENKRVETSEFLGRVNHYTRYDVTILGGHGYRLPTEAEWEYACRARTDGAYFFGSACNGRRANINGKHPFGALENGSRAYPASRFLPAERVWPP